MSRSNRLIIGGVDTHAATHHAAVIDLHGRLLADEQFPAPPRGYTALLSWMRSQGRRLDKVGIEGTGAYGAGLARHLHEHDVSVLEVPRPDPRLRQHGKSDPLDAEAAARTVLAGNASGAPKLSTGTIEAIRMLRIARAGAVKGHTAARNTLQAVVVTAPEPLRSQLRELSTGSSSRPACGCGPTATIWPTRCKPRRHRCSRSRPAPELSNLRRER
jgi:transposase